MDAGFGTEFTVGLEEELLLIDPATRELAPVATEVLGRLDRCGGFPKRLALGQQGEFALGFYHQRAEFKAQRPGSRAAGAAPEQRPGAAQGVTA